MKKAFSILLVSVFSALGAARGDKVEIYALPPPLHADTEVCTNFPAPFWEPRARTFKLTLSFAATPSNNVQAAFGGNAAPKGAEETAVAVGWDCGRWFIEAPSTGFRSETSSANTNLRKTLVFKIRVDRRLSPVSLEALDNKAALSFPGIGGTNAVPSWLAPAGWKFLRLTARGENIRADEKFSVSSYPDGTVVILK